MRRIVLNFVYWYAHWKAYQKVAKQLHCWKFRFLFHDIEKPFLMIFLPHKVVQKLHRKWSRHHAEFIFPKYRDYLGMVIDWECSRFTKTDKQLNAEETLYKYYPELKFYVLPILWDLKLI